MQLNNCNLSLSISIKHWCRRGILKTDAEILCSAHGGHLFSATGQFYCLLNIIDDMVICCLRRLMRCLVLGASRVELLRAERQRVYLQEIEVKMQTGPVESETSDPWWCRAFSLAGLVCLLPVLLFVFSSLLSPLLVYSVFTSQFVRPSWTDLLSLDLWVCEMRKWRQLLETDPENRFWLYCLGSCCWNKELFLETNRDTLTLFQHKCENVSVNLLDTECTSDFMVPCLRHWKSLIKTENDEATSSISNIRRPDAISALSVHAATPETFVRLEASVLQPAVEKRKPKKDRYLWGMWWRAKYFVLPLHSSDIISCTSLPIPIRAGSHISALSHARLECSRVLLLQYLQFSSAFHGSHDRHEDGWMAAPQVEPCWWRRGADRHTSAGWKEPECWVEICSPTKPAY